MSYNHIGSAVCDECHITQYAAAERFIEVYWARGNAHYCSQCWPRNREYYEGSTAWKRVGSFFASSD